MHRLATICTPRSAAASSYPTLLQPLPHTRAGLPQARPHPPLGRRWLPGLAAPQGAARAAAPGTTGA